MVRPTLYSLCMSVCLFACGSESAPDATAGTAGTATAGTTGHAGREGNGGSDAEGGGSSCTMNLDCTLRPPPSTGDVRQDCLNRINQFRTQCACLPALERWTNAEACADAMATHDGSSGKAHAGFTARICSPGGNGQNECPSYPSESVVIDTCLQQMWSEGPPPDSRCEGSCFQQHGHFINMTNPQFKRVACGFHRTDSGKVWSVQNFAP